MYLYFYANIFYDNIFSIKSKVNFWPKYYPKIREKQRQTLKAGLSITWTFLFGLDPGRNQKRVRCGPRFLGIGI